MFHHEATLARSNKVIFRLVCVASIVMCSRNSYFELQPLDPIFRAAIYHFAFAMRKRLRDSHSEVINGQTFFSTGSRQRARRPESECKLKCCTKKEIKAVYCLKFLLLTRCSISVHSLKVWVYSLRSLQAEWARNMRKKPSKAAEMPRAIINS